MTKPPPEERDDDVLLTPRQQRSAEREAKRQAKDDAYEAKLARKRSKDVHYWHGRTVVDTKGLREAFPEPETPEYTKSTVRRRITHGVTLVILLAIVVAGVVLAGMVQRGELELKLGYTKPVDPSTVCPADTLTPPANKLVTVNVFNAGTADGAAGKISAALKTRGYKLGTVGNGATQYMAPVVIVAGPEGLASALNLQRLVNGAEFVQDDRQGVAVDFIVTDGYAGLLAQNKISAKPGKLQCPRLEKAADPSLAPTNKPSGKATSKPSGKP